MSSPDVPSAPPVRRQQQGSAAPPELAPAITTLPSRQQPTAAAPGAAPAQAPTATASGVAGDAEMEDARALAAQPHEPLVPFALIDELSEGSPASSAGLQVRERGGARGRRLAAPGFPSRSGPPTSAVSRVCCTWREGGGELLPG